MDSEQLSGHPSALRVMLIALPLVAWGLRRLVETVPDRLTCVGVAASVADAVAQVPHCRPQVVVLDVDTETDKASLTSLLAAGSGPVLVLTGSHEAQVQDRAVLAGARGVVDKREAPETLLKAVEKVHAGEMWLDRGATGRIFLELARQQLDASSPNPEQDRIALLTPRERQTVVALARDASSPGKVLAEKLHISEHTLRNHLTSIYAKLEVTNRVDLYAFALRNGLGT